MDDIMLCPSCGKELPKESSFCPYCMTKFTPETPMGNSKTKSKKPLIIIVAAVAVVVAAAVAAAVLLVPEKNNTASENFASQTVSALNTNPPAGTTVAPSDDADTSPAPETQLHDTAVGFLSGGFDDAFYCGGFFTAEHSSLVASESAYKGARIKFECIVLKVEGDTAFVEYGATKGFDGVYNSTADYAAVKINTQVSPGDSLVVYGTYTGVADYTVGGKGERLPTFEMQSCTDFVYYGVLCPVLTKNDISAAAQRIFGDNVTVRESVCADFSDNSVADILVDGGLFYTAVTDYGSFCFYAGENSFILDCASTVEAEKYILPAVGSDNIYSYTFDNVSGKFTLACLDKNFNTLWTREFKNSADAVFDYTSDYFYVVADSNLYVLDVSAGENAVSPKYVGSRCGIVKVESGLILVSDKNTDTVLKTDLCGNAVWRVSLSGDISDSQVNAQSLVSGYLVSFENEAGGCYTAFVTDDGKVTFEHNKD